MGGELRIPEGLQRAVRAPGGPVEDPRGTIGGCRG